MWCHRRCAVVVYSRDVLAFGCTCDGAEAAMMSDGVVANRGPEEHGRSSSATSVTGSLMPVKSEDTWTPGHSRDPGEGNHSHTAVLLSGLCL